MPKTSIIILTYNQLAYTQICLESIRLYTNDYELIVVDNASTDGTVEWLKKQNDIITIFNSENKGFPAGCNQGIRQAAGDVIVLLNNDTIVTPRWLDNLLICLNSSEKIGAVGPATNFSSYYQFIPVTYDKFNFKEISAFAEKRNNSNPSSWKERLKLTGFCLAFKKEVLAKTGLLDERFSPGYTEDDDFCFSIISAGYKVMFCADSFVHHFGNVSFNELYQDRAKVFELFPDIGDGQEKFIRKWGFCPFQDTIIRFDLLKFIKESDSEKNIRILEIGCGCGATLLELKNLFPRAHLCGIERNKNLAQISQYFAEIKIGDAEKIELDYPNEYFDYILLPNILEKLVNPGGFLGKIKKFLNPRGTIIASVFNVMHYSVLSGLLKGNWDYNNVILAKTNLRFFTLQTISDLFLRNGCAINKTEERLSRSGNVKPFLDYLSQVVPQEKQKELLVAQYNIEASLTTLPQAQIK